MLWRTGTAANKAAETRQNECGEDATELAPDTYGDALAILKPMPIEVQLLWPRNQKQRPWRKTLPMAF